MIEACRVLVVASLFGSELSYPEPANTLFTPPSMKRKESRCPYCVVEDEFHPMSVVAEGRLICKKCGHIVFPNDSAFRCPCQGCLKINFSPLVRRVHPR